jgi:hypothetical protein
LSPAGKKISRASAGGAAFGGSDLVAGADDEQPAAKSGSTKSMAITRMESS